MDLSKVSDEELIYLYQGMVNPLATHETRNLYRNARNGPKLERASRCARTSRNAGQRRRASLHRLVSVVQGLQECDDVGFVLCCHRRRFAGVPVEGRIAHVDISLI